MHQILIVEDDPALSQGIRLALGQEGRQFVQAGTIGQAERELAERTFDLLILDLNLPDGNGLDLLSRLRDRSALPVLILTANDLEMDQVTGLELGADDYVTKPFSTQELVARVRSQLRRYTLLGDVHAEERQGLIVNGRLTYDPDRRELRADGEAVKLTATETKIVDLLMRNPGRIFPAEEIYRRVWDGEAAYACENTVMVHIRRIREKIELNPKEPDYIKVVWGIGYKMEQHGT